VGIVPHLVMKRGSRHGGVQKSIAKTNPRDFRMFSCSKTTNELNYTAQKFVRSEWGKNQYR